MVNANSTYKKCGTSKVLQIATLIFESGLEFYHLNYSIKYLKYFFSKGNKNNLI